jgi:hypothetical protein
MTGRHPTLGRQNLDMARIADITFDCEHPASLARFWAATLDGYEIAPYDDAEIERLRSLGYDGPEDDPGVMVIGPGPRVCCQLVPEQKTAKNRAHLDLRCEGDLGAEVDRLLALGATKLAHQPDGGEWVALADPAGNEFCVSAD